MENKIPNGPGQVEKTGMGDSLRDGERPGTYKDPQSGAESTVPTSAGADALVRLGWVFQEPLNK